MEVREKVEYLPHSPGVYRFLNEEGTVIYVGKAKDLIRRFKSVARVKKASLEDLTAAVGKKQAEIIYQHYHNTLL